MDKHSGGNLLSPALIYRYAIKISIRNARNGQTGRHGARNTLYHVCAGRDIIVQAYELDFKGIRDHTGLLCPAIWSFLC